MRSADKIKTAFERSAKALTLRPSLGRGTGVSHARIAGGLAVEITEGPWKLTADMPPQAGGDGAGPTPGVYGRAALGSCLAIGYAMEAARAGLDVASIDVEVQADYDDGALFCVSPNPPGYLEVRYTVTVASDAPEEEIRRFVDAADAHSPYLDVFRRAQECVRTVRVVPPGTEER
jgi:uncharacterized OsmC-like protein